MGEKILKSTITICSVLILLLPLLVTKSTMFSFIFPKIIFFQIFVTISFLAWILLALKNPAYRPNWKHPLLLTPLIFLVSLLVTAIFGVDFSNSLWSSQERMLGIFTLLHFYVWFIILITTYTLEYEWKNILRASLGVSIFILFFGFSQGFTVHITSTLGNQLFLGSYALIHFYLALILFFYEKNNIGKFFAIFTALIAIITILLTGERTPLIVLFFGIILLPLLFFIGKTSLKAKVTGISLYGIIILLSISLFWFTTPQGRQIGEKKLPFIFQKTLYLFSEGLQDRVTIWSLGLDGFYERPLIGWGWENFNIVFNKYVNASEHKNILNSVWFDRSHNQVIDVLALSGIVGFITYFFLWLCITWFLRVAFIATENTKKKKVIGILSIAFLSYFIQNLSIFDTPVTLIIFYLMLALLYFILCENTTLEINDRYRMPGKYIFIVTPLIGIVLFAILFQTSIQPFLKSQLAVKAKNTAEKGKFDESLILFKYALDGNYFTNREIRHVAANVLIASIHQQAIPNEQQKKWVLFLKDEIEKNITKYPYDLRQYLIGSLIYRAAHKFDQDAILRSYELMQKAIILAPNKQDVFYEFAQVEAQRKEFESARKWAQRAVEVAIDDDSKKQALWTKATITIRAGLWREGIDDLYLAYNTGYPIENESKFLYLFITTYIPYSIDKEAAEKIIFLIKELQKRKNSELFMASIIILYDKAGEYENARRALDELTIYNKDVAIQVKEFLKKSKENIK